MQVVNNTIFDATSADVGKWRNISNFVALSVHVTGILNGSDQIYIEAANDPNILSNSNGSSAPTAQATGQEISGPNTPSLDETFYIILTYVTPQGGGETDGGPVSDPIIITPGHTLEVNSPDPDPDVVSTHYNVYLSTDGVSFFKQNDRYSEIGPEIQHGPIPIGKSFILYGFDNAFAPVPLVNTSGGPGAGLRITGDLGAGAASITDEIGVFYNNDSSQAMVNPSCLAWNWIRVVRPSAGSNNRVQAFLFGQNG